MPSSAPPQSGYVIGVDVGTGSARAGVFTLSGVLVGTARHDIGLFSDGAHVEQSSADVWQAVGRAVRDAVGAAKIDPSLVAGIGFDATCSLVVLGADGASLPVGAPGNPERDIIVWMDHRATDQAERINRTGHAVLKYVGNRISPEMQTPKLLWLKENRPGTFAKAAHFFDLTDFLTWKSTGSLARSICTTTCKWTYLGHEKRWDADYFRTIGLAELADEDFARIGSKIVNAATAVGSGLTSEAAAAFGLPAGTPVGTGLIDAHAGGVGTIGAASQHAAGSATSRLAYVFGTSACTMTSTLQPAFIPGIWGPYFSAMVPGLWLNEGGQSAAGAAIDHIVASHPASAEGRNLAKAAGKALTQWLADAVSARTDAASCALMADGLHIVPEFLGNRAPFADPDARAVIVGLDMDASLAGLLRLYVAAVCSLGYGLRQIVRTQESKGVFIEEIVVSGGAGQHPLVRQLLADSTGYRVCAPASPEPVLLGSAMLGAVAGRRFDTLAQAMLAMSSMGAVHLPATGKLAEFHDRRFEAFEMLQQTARALRT